MHSINRTTSFDLGYQAGRRMRRQPLIHRWSLLRCLAPAALVVMLVLLPYPSLACAFRSLGPQGAIGRDGTSAFVSKHPDPERPGLFVLEWFGRDGSRIAAHELETAVRGGVEVVALADDGSVWVRIRCSALASEERCARLVEVSQDGRLGKKVSLNRGQGVVWAGDGRFETFPFGGGVRELLDPETGETVAPENGPSAGFLEGTDRFGEIRVRDPAGGWIRVRQSTREVIFHRFDSSGTKVAERRYAIGDADWREDAMCDAPLGTLSGLIVDPAGYLLAPQLALGAHCTLDQWPSIGLFEFGFATDPPPSVAIFDRDFALLGVALTHDGFRQARVLEQELVVLSAHGLMERFHLDGRPESEPWWPPMHRRPCAFENMKEVEVALDSLTADDPVDELAELYVRADASQRARIATWLVEAGPAAYGALDDRLWLELAGRLCVVHPDSAPLEVARRFARSVEDLRVAWLEALPLCFDRPLQGAEALADLLLRLPGPTDRFFERAAHEALNAWDYSREQLDTLWADALTNPSVGSSVERLTRAFAQDVEGFDRRLEGADEVTQAQVIEMLRMTVVAWHPDRLDTLGKRQVARALPALLLAAETWSESEDIQISSLGRLIRLGHGAEDAAQQLAHLLTASEALPSLLPLVTAALVRVYDPREPSWTEAENRAALDAFLALEPFGRALRHRVH